jgi:hypothetical protein
VVVERFPEMRASTDDGQPARLQRLVILHTDEREVVLEVDDATYWRLTVGTRVTLRSEVGGNGRPKNGRTLIIFDGGAEPAPSRERGTNA